MVYQKTSIEMLSSLGKTFVIRVIPGEDSLCDQLYPQFLGISNKPLLVSIVGSRNRDSTLNASCSHLLKSFKSGTA